MPQLNLFRRHTKKCPHRNKGRRYTKCTCAIWFDGDRNGKEWRGSLRLRDWNRAIRKLALMESQSGLQSKLVPETIGTWKGQLKIESSTTRKYGNTLRCFQEFCQREGLDTIDMVDLERLDKSCLLRKVARTTLIREIQVLRQFFTFCVKRKWVAENWAKELEAPKNVKPREVVPYTPQEVAAILAACDGIGSSSYERRRARAMILLLRYAGLRISDVAMLAKDRIRNGQVMLFTQKTGCHVLLPIPKELQDALDSLPLPRRSDGVELDSGYFFWNGVTSKRAAVGCAERTLAAVFRGSKVRGAHAHRFRHTLATSMLASGGTLSDVADVLGISQRVAEKHYAKWSSDRQTRITNLLRAVHAGTPGGHEEKMVVIQ